MWAQARGKCLLILSKHPCKGNTSQRYNLQRHIHRNQSFRKVSEHRNISGLAIFSKNKLLNAIIFIIYI